MMFLTTDADGDTDGDAATDTPPDDAIAEPTPRDRETNVAAVMQVNSTFITIEDVIKRRRAELQDLPAALDEMNFRLQAQAIVRDGTRELVRQALLYETANNRLSDEDKELLDNEVRMARQEMINRAGGSLGKLHEQLAAEGLTLTDVLADHRKRLVIELNDQRKRQLSLYVSRKMMWDYYQAHEADFTTPKRVAMQLIVIDANVLAANVGDTSDAGMEKARALAKKRIRAAQVYLQEGTPFDKVAKQFSTDARASEGGLWPMMQQDGYRLAKVAAAAFELEQGQVSDIIEDGDCVAIVRAAQIDPGGKTSFEVAQRTIENILRDELYRAMREKQFMELLRTAYIQQNDDFYDRCVQYATETYWRRR